MNVTQVKDGIRERKFSGLSTLIQHYVALGELNGLATGLNYPVLVAGATVPAAAAALNSIGMREDPYGSSGSYVILWILLFRSSLS